MVNGTSKLWPDPPIILDRATNVTTSHAAAFALPPPNDLPTQLTKFKLLLLHVFLNASQQRLIAPHHQLASPFHMIPINGLRQAACGNNRGNANGLLSRTPEQFSSSVIGLSLDALSNCIVNFFGTKTPTHAERWLTLRSISRLIKQHCSRLV